MSMDAILNSGLDPESQSCKDENAADLALLQKEYCDRFRPRTPDERFQVDNLIRNEWMLRRLFRVEAQLWDWAAANSGSSQDSPLGQSFEKFSPVFMRLQRRITAAERAYERATKELQRLQSTSAAQAVEPCAEVQKPVLAAGPKP